MATMSDGNNGNGNDAMATTVMATMVINSATPMETAAMAIIVTTMKRSQ